MDERNQFSQRAWKPKQLILHDYGGTPKNEPGVHNPYHALVFPDGSIRHRNPADPYGVKAPHAYKLNGQSIGLSYAGPVGSQPTAAAMGALKSESQRIAQAFPGIQPMSHGQAFRETAGTPLQASRDGRGLEEASWRSKLIYGPPNPNEPTATASATPMSNRGITTFAGMAAPPAEKNMAVISPEWTKKRMALGGPPAAPGGMAAGMPSRSSDDRLAAYASSMANQPMGRGWEALAGASGRIVGGMLLGQVGERDKARQAATDAVWSGYGSSLTTTAPAAPRGMAGGVSELTEMPMKSNVTGVSSAPLAAATPSNGVVRGMLAGPDSDHATKTRGLPPLEAVAPMGMAGGSEPVSAPSKSDVPADPRMGILDRRSQALAAMVENPETRAFAIQQLQQIEQQRLQLMDPGTDLERRYKEAQIGKLQSETEKLSRESQAGGVTGPYKDMKQKADVEEGLRREITKSASDYTTIRDSAAKIEAIAKQPSAASDVALIYSFMKVLDPGSVVRETEYATAQNAAGVPDQVRNVWNRVMSGERLNETQRADFLSQAKTLASVQETQYARTLDQYRGVAERLGVDPRNVILDGRNGDGSPVAQRSSAASPPDPSGAIAKPKNAAEYEGLQPGAKYVDPEGNVRTKQ